ncbi:hypothetical protein EMIT0P12_80026 [Pseudomonas sp. IT-P12]
MTVNDHDHSGTGESNEAKLDSQIKF